MAGERSTYSDAFKQEMVELYNSDKPRAELIRAYELTLSVLFSWINKYNSTGSFNIDNNT
ncbi:hypothetical protein B5E92_10020 [Erysipelatoclostridium sp. An15]|nr:hypothetical protein B5E92_10020 [Erysipelatoclostridium sp. An15]